MIKGLLQKQGIESPVLNKELCFRHCRWCMPGAHKYKRCLCAHVYTYLPIKQDLVYYKLTCNISCTSVLGQVWRLLVSVMRRSRHELYTKIQSLNHTQHLHGWNRAMRKVGSLLYMPEGEHCQKCKYLWVLNTVRQIVIQLYKISHALKLNC